MRAGLPKALFQYLDKIGRDNALIRGHQTQTVNAGCGRDRAVGGITQDVQERHLAGNLIGQRKDSKDRAGTQVLKEFIQWYLQGRLFSAREDGDFKQADRAEGHRLVPLNSRFERP